MKYFILLLVLFSSCQKQSKHHIQNTKNVTHDAVVNAILADDSLAVKRLKKEIKNGKKDSKINTILQNYINLYEYTKSYKFEKVDLLEWNNIDELFNSGYPIAAIDFAFHKLNAIIYTENDAEFLAKVETYLNLYKDYQKNCEYGKLLQVKITYLQKKEYYNLALEEMYHIIKNYNANEECSDLLSSTQFEMSFLYSFLKLPKESLKSAQEALKYAKSNGNLALANSLVARAYLDLEQPELGIGYIQKAIQLENKDNLHMLNYHKAILIQTYADLNENSKVDEMFFNFEQSKDYMAYHEFLFCLAKAKSLRNRKLYNESIEVYLQAKKLLNKENLLRERIILKDLAEVHKLNNNLHVAYTYLQEYQKNEDEFTAISNKNRISEQIISLDLAKKEAAIQESKRKSLEKDLLITQKDKTILGTVLLIVFLSLSSMLIYYYLSVNKKKNILLTEQKNKIEQINVDLNKAITQKEWLMREIHHRVKNHLQFMTSMLGIQSRVKTNSVEEFVQITNNRLAAIAAIHEQLYEKHESKELDLALVLGQLAKSLAKIKNNELSITVNSNQQVIIATHLCVSVALIINELISNSIKHNALNSNQSVQINLIIKDTHLIIKYLDQSNFNYQLIQTNPISGTKILLILLEQLNSKIDKETGVGIFEFSFPIV